MVPSTPEAIKAAGAEGVGLIVDPIAFVSEHVETLVELDRDYGELAKAVGVPCYLRCPHMWRRSIRLSPGLPPRSSARWDATGVKPDGERCAAMFGRCPLKDAARAV